MPDTPLNCAEARRRMADSAAGAPYPPLAAHLAECEACRDALLEAALRQPPAVTIPPRFAAQVLAQLPAEEPNRPWAPATAAILFALVGVVLWWRGDAEAIAQTLVRWQALAGAAALEAALVFAWAWRASRSPE